MRQKSLPGSRQGNILVFFLIGALLVTTSLASYFFWKNQELKKTLTYDVCLKTPGAIDQQSYPCTCVTPEGRSVIQPLSDAEKKKPIDEAAQAGTSNWKTYQDTKLGFSIKYPPSYSRNQEINDITKQYAVVFNKGTSPVYDVSLTISIDKDPRNGESRTSSNPLGDQITKPEDSFAIENPEKFNIQGYPAAKAILKNREGSTAVVVSIIKEGALWQLIGNIQNTNDAEISEVDQILSTFKFTTNGAADTSASPTLTAKKLSYSLPTSWQTLQDRTGTLQVGYDPKLNQLGEIKDLSIELAGKWEMNPPRKIGSNMTFFVKLYDGGSRHAFILGNQTDWEKLPTYHEKIYVYNDWNCLVLYGTYISQSDTVHGMCATSAKQAMGFSVGGGTDADVERIISTIRLLK